MDLPKRNRQVRCGRYFIACTLVKGTKALPSMLMDALEGPTEKVSRELLVLQREKFYTFAPRQSRRRKKNSVLKRM